MGNTKSRHVPSSGSNSPSTRKQTKRNSRTLGQHQQQNAPSSSRYSNNNHDTFHNNNYSYYDNYRDDDTAASNVFPGQMVPNDSGHYSVHGSVAPMKRPEFLGGSFHTNMSSPGRLDQQKKSSDSSLQLQYGSRVKRAPPSGATRIAVVPGEGAGGTGTGMDGTNSGSFSVSGTPQHPDQQQHQQSYGTYGPNIGAQEMIYQPQQTYYQLESNSRPTSSLRHSHGRMSSFTQQQQQYSRATSPLSIQPSQPHQQQQQQQPPHQYQRMSNGSPTPLGGSGYRDNTVSKSDNRIPSLTALTLEMNDGRPSMQQQGPSYDDPSFGQRGSAMAPNGSRQTANLDGRIRNNEYSCSSIPNAKILKGSTNMTTNNITRGTSAVPKASEVFASAGPLIDAASLLSSSSRPLTADQVFAQLQKQNPTNPRETDKRERIYRWLDDVTRALTFNPDTNIPGWIIPVIPDDHDQPESPFYVDRITYELDLMAPLTKPFRKAIDINCATGEWAMDLALKYPRTIVYALDTGLDVSRLPLRIPENCRFKLRDVRDQEGEFDLVHQRLGAFRTQILEWTPHFAELGRLTRAGGWIQLAECNGMIVRAGLESLKVNRWVEKAALSSGLNPMQMVEALMPTILGAGLINVECYEYGIPLGDWAGHRGQVAMRTYLRMVESLREEIIEMNRLEEGVFEETVAMMKMECSVENAELIMKVICAQKPPFSDDIWR
ncbi:hypothetical protein EDD11_008104 [Mortierella claussenii]|nr:hypothetical protein EDD11_008104 [Mortierella claussenii]